MTKITVDKGLIEQAVKFCETWPAYGGTELASALRAALAEPAVEPVAYRSLLASGSYTYCITKCFFDNAEPLYTAPQPPAEVPLLTAYELEALEVRERPANGPKSTLNFARAIEQSVRQKAGLK